MSSLSGKLTAKGTFVDTNNDGVVDGFAHTIKGVSGWTTFSLSNGVLSLQPSGAGAGSVPGANTQVIFNDSGSYGAATGAVYSKTFDSNSGKLTVTNLTVSGDLVVSGATTTVSSNTVTIGDNIIVLNNDESSAPSQNAGIEIERGTSANVQFLWDEANDQWDFDTFALGSVGKVYGSGSGAIYTFTSDTDTGIEHTGTNQLGVLVGNTRVLMANSAGISINASGASGSALYALEVTGAIEVDNILLDANTISSQDTNGHLTLAPNGTGDLLVRADTVQIGDNNANATFTTYGTGDLIINTNSGTNSASITIEDGANNDVLVIPNGTGKVGIGQATPTKLLHVGGDALIDGNLTVSGTTMTVSTTNSYISDRLITLNNNEAGNGVTGTYAGFEIDRGDTGDNPNQIARFVWNESTDKFTVQLETGSGTGSYNAANFIAADGAFTTASTSGLATLATATVTGDLTVDGGTLAVDSSNNRVGVNVGSPTVPLDVSGNSLFTGQMEVTGGIDGAVIVKVRNETGSAIAAGTPVYVIGYSSGNSRPLIAIADANVTSKMPVIGVLTTQLNNTTNGYIATYGRTTVPSTIFTGTTPAIGHAVYVSDTIGKLTVDKPTSGTTEIQFIGEVLQGGGTITLLLQGSGRINDVPNAISALTGTFTNQVQVGSLLGGAANGMIRYNNPNLEGYVNGAWASLNTDTNTTYVVSAETVAGGANLRLTDSGAGTDDVKIASGTNTTVTRTDANTITVSSTDTNTQLTTEQVQDIVGAMFGSNTETRIAVTYEDGDGTIDLVVDDMTADTQLTTEQVQDIVGAMVAGNTETNITVTYQDGDGTIDFISTDTNTTYSAGSGLALATTTFSLNHLGLQSLTDPNADRVAFWDDSAGAFDWLQMGTGLTITGTTLNASAVSEVFKTISVSGQSDIVADTSTDTLTFAAGSNVAITTTAGTDTITIASTDTNTQLTTEQVQDIVGAMFGSNTETRIAVTYQDGDGTIDLVVDDMTTDTNTWRTVTAGGNTLSSSETLAFTAGSNVTVTESAGAVTIASADTNTQLSAEQVQDIVGAMFGSNTETRIAVTYDDGDGTIDLVVDDMTANTQLTTEQVQDIVGAMFGSNTETRIAVTYQDGDGTIDLVVDDMTANDDVSVANLKTRLAGGFSSNVVTIGDSTDVVTIGNDLVITGDLTVSGDTTTVNTATLNISDNIVVLNNDVTGTPSENAGIEVERGTSANVSIRWSEGDDRWELTNDGTTYSAIGTSSATGTVTSVAGSAGAGISISGSPITTSGTLTITNTDLGSSQNIFKTIAVSGQSNVVADSNADTLTLAAGSNVTITTTAGTDTITIASADTNTQLSQEQVEDYVAGVVTAGSNVSVTYDDAGGTLTIAATDTNTQLSTEQVQDIVGAMVTGNTETNIAVTYQDGDGTIDFVSTDTQLTTETVQDIVGAMFGSNTETRIAVTYDDGDGTIDLVVDDMTANTQLSTEEVQDIVGAMVTGNTETNIAVTYQDGDGTIDFVSTNTTYTASTGLALGGGAFSLSHLGIESLADPNADRILFWDDSESAVKFLSAGSNLSISGTTLSATNTDTQLSTEEVQDIVGAMVTGNTETNIAVTYQDGDGTIDFVSTDTTYSAGTGLALAGTTFNVTGLTTSEIAAASILISSDSFADVDNQVMSAAAINDRIQSFNYITNSVTSLTSLTTVGPGTGTLTVQDDLTITGDLIVSGTTTTVNTATLSVADNIVVLNNDVAGAPSENAGIEIERGTSTNVLVRWNETSDRWEFTNDGSTYYNIPLSSEYTANVGDITGVAAGTGLSGGGTSGSVTLNVSTGAVSNGATTIPTGDHVYDFVTGLGYTTNTGDITGVTAGVGLSGGGSSGGVTLTLDMSELTDMTQAVNSAQDELIILDNGADRRKLISEIPLSAFSNDSGFISNTVSGNFTVDTTTLYVDATNNRVGVGTVTPSVSLESTGTIKGSILESTNHLKVGGLSGSAATGMIRWSGSNFEGYTGSAWKALDVQSAGANLDAGVAGQIVIYGSGGSTAVGDGQLTYNSTDDILLVGSTYFGGDEATNASLANASALTTLSLPKATYRSIKAVVSIKDTTNTEYQSSEILVTHNGTNATYTTYGEIYTGAAAIGTITADISGSNMRILFTNGQGGTINATAKVSWQAIPV